MKRSAGTLNPPDRLTFRLLLLLLLLLIPVTSQASFTIKVMEGTTLQPINDFKWIVQEDNTFDAVGHVGQFNNYSTLSTSIHKSQAPVLASGSSANPVVNLPSSGRYFVSVNAPGHYPIGGGEVRPGQSEVNILTYKFPVPLAQATVLIFQDNMPINGAPDLPDEVALAGFRVYLYDQLGQQSQDAFGNPIGTIYKSDANGQPILDPNGSPILISKGPGYVVSGPTMDANFNYNARIPNLAPGKYGIWAQPDDGRPWIQTSTIEGTPGIDIWILAGEPNYFTANGTFGTHADIGFVLPTEKFAGDASFPATQFATTGPGEIAGQVVQNRLNRPPLQAGLNPGDPVPEAYIGLSDNNAANQAVFVMGCPGTITSGPAAGSECDQYARYHIKGVPPSTYTLTMWDKPLDQTIDFRTVTVPAPTPTTPNPAVSAEICPDFNINNISSWCPSPIFQWFGTLEGSVTIPFDNNGVLSPNPAAGLPNQLMDLRFRDGSINQQTLTASDGTYSFPEVFPFFKFMVAGVDAVTHKALGATAKVDKGGPFATWSPTGNNIIPLLDQPTFAPGTQTLANMLYFGETNVIDWYKKPYAPGEVGYIAGMVSYAFTRAPGDVSLAGQNPWEPGIPNMTMKLYKVTGYDASNKPIFDHEHPVATVLTDSWDRAVFKEKSLVGCLDAMRNAGIDINAASIPLDKYIDCSETMPIWNQVKTGVYDGAYIFFTDDAGNPLTVGDYVVEAVTPPGYEVRKEEDQNFIVSGPVPPDIVPSSPQPVPPSPQPAITPPPCVGPDHVVPAFLTYDGVSPAPFAGETRPLCTMKLVHMDAGLDGAADFRFFTQVEPAARLIGLITDDLSLEFRQGSPRLGDKPGVPFMPVSIQDYMGREIVRTYSDEWGQYNALVPSTYWTNTPNPTGVSPHLVNIVLNPKFLVNDKTKLYDPTKPDPYYNSSYPTSPFPMDFWPGKITYADTPMVPIRPAIDTTPVDCNVANGIPVIKQVNGPGQFGGPWVETPTASTIITITSSGTTEVPNPDRSVGGLITKDYGFGPGGDVYVTPLGAEFGSPSTQKLKVPAGGWTNASITPLMVTLNPDGTDGPLLTAGDYQVTVVRNDTKKATVTGITLHVGIPAGKVHYVTCDPTGQATPGPIQSAIDTADNGDLILVGTRDQNVTCPENIIMWKPVKLQGFGAATTLIEAGAFTPVKQTDWTAKLNAITNGQVVPSPWLIDAQQPDFFLESGSAVLVLAPNVQTANLVNGTPALINPYDNGANKAMIDGFSMTGANLGGAVYVNANAHYMQISNNKMYTNQGTFGGGVRIGTPTAVSNLAPTVYESSLNDNVTISHNEISFNGATGFNIGSGGGIGLFKGSDNYAVTNNWVCGNYALLAGAGIAQQGLSTNGLIKNNTIIFNESFDEGAGILLSGETPITPATTLTEGVGNVVIDANLIQGNKGGNLGGGIALLRYNGQDVAANNTNIPPVPPAATPATWYKAEIYNNMIVNNLSGAFGGGIGISDALDVTIANNTIANNDSTATGELAFGNSSIILDGADPAFSLPPDRQTTPMPAGIGVQPVSTPLIGAIGPSLQPSYQNIYAVNPVIVNDIIYGNMSYYWPGFDPNVNAGINVLAPFGIWDLGVFTDPAGTAGLLTPKYSVITGINTTPIAFNRPEMAGNNNVLADPQMISTYRNEISATQGGAALGNFVSFTYSPLTLTGNYHVKGSSPARGVGSVGAPVFTWNPQFLDFDFDDDSRTAPVDIGADQVNSKGDLNGDGIVNGQDALIALQMAVGVYPKTNPPVTAAVLANVHVAPLSPTGRPAAGSAVYDPPTTNTVTVADAMLILQRAIGLIFW